jgi:hypothetical protein
MAGKLCSLPHALFTQNFPQYHVNGDYCFIPDIDIFQDDPEDGLEGGEYL